MTDDTDTSQNSPCSTDNDSAAQDAQPDGGVTTDGPRTVTARALDFDLGQLLDGVGTPVFALDAEGRVAVWNAAIEELTGVSAGDALGTEHVSEAFYPDGRRAQTLADKVLAHPDDADREFGLDRMDGDARLYVDESVMTDRHGVDRHIRFNAMPLYDGEELAGVVEVVHDRTADVQQSQQTQALVDELDRTIRSVARGNLADRATFEHPTRTATGIPHVLVDGEFVVREGDPTGATPGGAIRM